MHHRIKLFLSLFLLIFFAVPGSRLVLAHEENEHMHVLIDIKPGSDPNVINLKNNGLVPLALFGSEFLDVRSVDIASVRLGKMHHHESGAPSVKFHLEDVNLDGIADLIFFFATSDLRTVLDVSNSAACLHGSFLDGTHFCGHDAVRILP